MCVFGTGWEKFTVYSDVWLRYRMGESILCTVMWFWCTGWEKFYCVQWWVSEVQCGRKCTVYSSVCLRYRMGNVFFVHLCVSEVKYERMLLCTVMCVWSTGWEKGYGVQWSVSEVQGGRNVTVYSDVCQSYSVRDRLLFTMMCDSEVRVGGKFTVYRDVFLRYRMGESLLRTVMCFWGTLWEKSYCV